MQHPRRDQLATAILQDPGITFRELMRQTGFAAGVLHHHLRVLEGHGSVVRRSQGKRTHFFAEGQAADGAWRGIVARRDPELRALHDWLRQRATTTRRDVFGHAAVAWDWKAGATHQRLGRLVGAGLLARIPGEQGIGYADPTTT